MAHCIWREVLAHLYHAEQTGLYSVLYQVLLRFAVMLTVSYSLSRLVWHLWVTLGLWHSVYTWSITRRTISSSCKKRKKLSKDSLKVSWFYYFHKILHIQNTSTKQHNFYRRRQIMWIKPLIKLHQYIGPACDKSAKTITINMFSNWLKWAL